MGLPCSLCYIGFYSAKLSNNGLFLVLLGAYKYLATPHRSPTVDGDCRYFPTIAKYKDYEYVPGAEHMKR